MAYKGKYICENPEKYVGDPTNIIFRSLWEKKLMHYLDRHDSVIRWASEEIFVPYQFNGKIKRYFPDFLVTQKNSDGVIETIMIEVKPLKETAPPPIENKRKTPTGRISRRYLREYVTYQVNSAKWNAARKYCAERGWKFQVMTENDLFEKKGKRKKK